MTTIAQRLHNEGRLEGEIKGRLEGEIKGRLEGEIKGLREAIELGITLKFPGDIDAVMARVNVLDDLETLTAVKEAIKTAKDGAEILALLK
jgi:predicted transposase YdaD